MNYKLQDLIDMAHFQNLQDRLNEIYSFPSAIIDNDGNVLTATGWQDVCTQFHRKNKDCLQECIKSDQYILSHLHEAKPAVSYRCPRGLVDNATPIIIDGVHYGNFFTGQFFLEQPDLEFFRRQAKTYGFAEDAYIEAVKKVPIWTQEQVNNYLFFIKGLIAIISESGLKKLREIETRKEVEESEKRHHSILQTAMDGFWLVDTQGRLLEVNETYCRMSGYSVPELLTMRISDLEVAEMGDATARHIQKIMTQGEDRFESRHRRKDGGEFDVEVSVQYRPTNGGRFVAFLRDITARKQTEEKLRESGQRLEFALEGGELGTWDWCPQTGAVVYSARWAQLLEYQPGEVEPTVDFFKQHVHPEDLPDVLERLTGHVEGRLPDYASEHRLRTKCGGWKWVSDHGKVAVRDQDGRPVRIIGVIADITARKQAEAARQKFAMLADSSSEFIGMCDLDFKPLYVNPAGVRMVGLPDMAAACEVKVQDYFFPEDQRFIVEEFFPRVLREGHGDVEIRLRHFQTGEPIWMFYYLFSVRDASGEIVGWATVSRDITARKQTDERLRLSEENLAITLQSIGDAVIATDAAGLITRMNGTAERLTGWPLADAIGRSLPDVFRIVNALTRTPVIDPVQLVMERGEVVGLSNHTVLLARDGREYQISDSAAPIRNPDGRIVGVVLVFRDITEEYRVQEELRKSEERFAAAFHVSPAAVNLATLKEGRIIDVNERYCQFFGYARDEVIGHTVLDLRMWAEPTSRAVLMQRLQTARSVHDCEARLRRKDGTVRDVLISVEMIDYPGVPEPVFLSMFTDITARKQAEEALRASLAEKIALLNEVHHRVKNNLQVITSLLRLEARRSEHPATKSVLGEMQGRILSMALLHDLLYRSGTFAAVDLGGYLKQLTTQAFRAQIVRPGSVRLQLDLTSVQVEMDQALPCGLLVNELISNCLKHGFPGDHTGEVQVVLQPVDGGPQLRLRVSDTGVGLPADFAAVRGTSLGLQLVSGLARQLDGRLEIGPGPGAVFEVTFTPKSVAAAATVPAAHP